MLARRCRFAVAGASRPLRPRLLLPTHIDSDPDDIRILSRSSTSVSVGTGPLACHRRRLPPAYAHLSPPHPCSFLRRRLACSSLPVGLALRAVSTAPSLVNSSKARRCTRWSQGDHTQCLSPGLLPPRHRSLIHPSSHAPNLARQTQPDECLLFGAATGRAHVSGACLNLSVGSSTCRCPSHKRNRFVRAASRPAPRALLWPCHPRARALSHAVRRIRTSSRPFRPVAQEHSALRRGPPRVAELTVVRC